MPTHKCESYENAAKVYGSILLESFEDMFSFIDMDEGVYIAPNISPHS